jgi:hypothetical protein
VIIILSFCVVERIISISCVETSDDSKIICLQLQQGAVTFCVSKPHHLALIAIAKNSLWPIAFALKIAALSAQIHEPYAAFSTFDHAMIFQSFVCIADQTKNQEYGL